MTVDGGSDLNKYYNTATALLDDPVLAVGVFVPQYR